MCKHYNFFRLNATLHCPPLDAVGSGGGMDKPSSCSNRGALAEVEIMAIVTAEDEEEWREPSPSS
jgi:hypothetical protein